MLIFVIDVGTSSMRGILYDEQAHVKLHHQITYRPQFLGSGIVEQNPQDWRRGLYELCGALGDYIREGGEHPDAIALTAQRSSVIPVSAQGEALSNAIMWQDQRTLPMKEELACHEQEIFRRSGSPVNPVFSGCKMRWLRRNRPELYHDAAKLIVIPDYLVHEMTGEFLTDTTYGARSLLMNLRTGDWDEQLLEWFGIDRKKLCTIVPPGSVCGTLTEAFAAQCGLRAGTPVVTAGGDQQCAALGLGILGSGDAEITTGTGAFILAGLDSLPETLEPNIIYGASAVPGRYLLEGSILTCCSAFDWFVRENYSECDCKNYCRVNEEIAQAEGTPVIVLPYFQGRATPDWNSAATASVHGLTLCTKRGDIARAILEGVCHEIVCNLDIMRCHTGELRRVHIGGGLTKSPVFPQLEADVLQLPLLRWNNPEATALGAWVQGAIAVGRFTDYREAVSAAHADDEEMCFVPRADMAEHYRAKQREFERLYHAQFGK